MRIKTSAAAGMAAWLCCLAPVLAADKVPAKAAVRPATKLPPANAVESRPPVAASSPAVPVITADLRAEMSRVFKAYVTPRFTVQDGDELDPETKAAARDMQAEHLPRVQALMERWLTEELQLVSSGRSALRRMQARLTNEFALWGRDSVGEAQDAALAQVLQVPGMCRPPSSNAGELVMRLARLRSLPAAQRQQAVQAERELLARWGQPRAVSDAEPLAAEDALLQLRATGQAPKVPLPPVLAFYYLGDDEDRRGDPVVADPSTRCALHQWAGANPAQFRAAMAMQGADFYGIDRRGAAARKDEDGGYPSIATFLGTRGVVTVEAEVNPEGRVVRAQVIKRDVRVPGISGVRPFAHEGTLDLASLARAREVDWSAAAPKQGLNKVTREFGWSLSWE